MKQFDFLLKMLTATVAIISVIFVSGLGGLEPAQNKSPDQPIPSSEPFFRLMNGVVDEVLNWLKMKYLCGYDPLVIPAVSQDDLNVSYSITISDIVIQGLSNVFRLSDVIVESYNETSRSMNSNPTTGSYIISSTLGIRNVALQFRIELLKIMSLSVVDFTANGSIPEIDIPIRALIEPSKKSIKFDQICIQHLDQLVLDIKQNNFLTLLGAWIPFVDKSVKKHIKDQIKYQIESRIIDAKTYLNNILSTVAQFQATSQRCGAEITEEVNTNMTESSTGIRLTNDTTPTPTPTPTPTQVLTTSTTPRPSSSFVITVGDQILSLPTAYSLQIKYKSKIIGVIPFPMNQPMKFFGYFNNLRNEFVLNNNGIIYRHLNINNDDPNWPLIVSRDENFFCLYAKDDKTETKLKLNPFIAKNYGNTTESNHQN